MKNTKVATRNARNAELHLTLGIAGLGIFAALCLIAWGLHEIYLAMQEIAKVLN